MESAETSDPVKQPEGYEPPRVDDVPTPDGPAVTVSAADETPVGPEWRPAGPREPGSSSGS